ncbi:LytR C-terminal domain-containing protein [Amycolatopsis taiwanensis]|uniref:LytR C-terminal domain-containing protein n=1 Tax=Amycolatopsis taiwanensis TaxID=342230 RepID=UPI0004800632|nr:LytR C-terminal domain-containing protein [Amycolatopsis taiwanensis]
MTFLKGLSRPVRLAGFALIGVALVALVIGTMTAMNGGSSQTAAPPASDTTQPSTGSELPPTSSPAPASPPANGATSPAGPPTQPPAQSAPANPGADQEQAKWVPVRVYNNSTITGLAARAADNFRSDGWNVAESGNYPYGIIPHSTAYFTPGTDEETAAKALAAAFGLRAEPRFEGIENSSPGVIVIVTNDFQGKGKD